MNLNCFKSLGLALTLIVASNGVSVAQEISVTGKITTLNLNSGVKLGGIDRTLCIRITPEIPATQGYACMWKDNTAYNEFVSVIKDAYIYGRTCRMASGGARDAFLEIGFLECN